MENRKGVENVDRLLWREGTKMEYSHSDNEEMFHGQFATHEEALTDALSNYADADFVYVAEVYQRTIGHYLNIHHIESLLESMAESAGEKCGEIVGEWLMGPVCPKKNIPGRPTFRTSAEEIAEYQVRIDAWRKEKADRLAFLLDGFRIVLETWATDTGEQPGFWQVENAKRYDMNGQLAPQ